MRFAQIEIDMGGWEACKVVHIGIICIGILVEIPDMAHPVARENIVNSVDEDKAMRAIQLQVMANGPWIF